jgi:outer membrane protein assembly factor BamA
VFRNAEVRFDPVGQQPDAATVPVEAVVAVQEPRRYLLRYGLELSNEYVPAGDSRQNALGVAADLRDRNFLGRGYALGGGVRYEPDLRSVRTLFSMPRFVGTPVRTNVYGTLRHEIESGAEGVRLIDDESNVSFEQRWRPRGWVDLSWGYTIDWREISIEANEPTPRMLAFDGRLAALRLAAVFDRRDSVFDAKRGWVQSTSLEWGLRAVGSEVDYVRALVRGSYYAPVRPFVLASNIRYGVLHAYGGTPPLTIFDLFFEAGGTQTVRGYHEDELSAYNFLGVELGGPRLLLLNQEIRFPLWRLFSGVLFADAGNTFADGQQISLADLGVGVGLGLRIRTPLAPIRIDLGFPLTQRSDDPTARWHFSIGQMF